ncbi:conserved Plasmodium protein, unknown function [Plasmodium vinckei vinckei]|uniref:HTH OST-type domain-containing protein n=1 Tax=Plasmodium vinckei vinckei TaxID=54757 RepID=A0A449BM26_PLAVN|nr:conserved Plasmodium protein, unknown function [Plasmodium vinckei vinckei]VEV54465.1 conserved Plasmodium protein, unknown function [Plasmodium vinckei vinckei]
MDYKVNQKESCDKYLIQYNENNEGSYIIDNYNKYKKLSRFNDTDINSCDNMHMAANKFNNKKGTSIIGNSYQKFNVHNNYNGNLDKKNEFETSKKGSYLLRNEIENKNGIPYKYNNNNNKTNCYDISQKDKNIINSDIIIAQNGHQIENKQNENMNYTNMNHTNINQNKNKKQCILVSELPNRNSDNNLENRTPKEIAKSSYEKNITNMNNGSRNCYINNSTNKEAHTNIGPSDKYKHINKKTYRSMNPLSEIFTNAIYSTMQNNSINKTKEMKKECVTAKTYHETNEKGPSTSTSLSKYENNYSTSLSVHNNNINNENDINNNKNTKIKNIYKEHNYDDYSSRNQMVSGSELRKINYENLKKKKNYKNNIYNSMNNNMNKENIAYSNNDPNNISSMHKMPTMVNSENEEDGTHLLHKQQINSKLQKNETIKMDSKKYKGQNYISRKYNENRFISSIPIQKGNVSKNFSGVGTGYTSIYNENINNSNNNGGYKHNDIYKKMINNYNNYGSTNNNYNLFRSFDGKDRQEKNNIKNQNNKFINITTSTKSAENLNQSFNLKKKTKKNKPGKSQNNNKNSNDNSSKNTKKEEGLATETANKKNNNNSINNIDKTNNNDSGNVSKKKNANKHYSTNLCNACLNVDDDVYIKQIKEIIDRDINLSEENSKIISELKTNDILNSYIFKNMNSLENFRKGGLTWVVYPNDLNLQNDNSSNNNLVSQSNDISSVENSSENVGIRLKNSKHTTINYDKLEKDKENNNSNLNVSNEIDFPYTDLIKDNIFYNDKYIIEPLIENTWLKRVLLIIKKESLDLDAFVFKLKYYFYKSVIFLYQEGIKAYLGDVANQMKIYIKYNFWSASEIAYILLQLTKICNLKIEVRIKGEIGCVIYLNEEPPNFKGFIDSHTLNNIFTKRDWMLLNEFAIQMMRYQSSEESNENCNCPSNKNMNSQNGISEILCLEELEKDLESVFSPDLNQLICDENSKENDDTSKPILQFKENPETDAKPTSTSTSGNDQVGNNSTYIATADKNDCVETSRCIFCSSSNKKMKSYMFNGGRYAFAAKLKEKINEFKFKRLGDIIHLVQLAIHKGIFVYSQRILLPVSACEKSADELYPKIKSYNYEICKTLKEVMNIISLLVDHRPNGLVLAQLKQQFILQYKKELNSLHFGYKKLQNLLLSDPFNRYYKLYIPNANLHRTHIQHRKFQTPENCKIFKKESDDLFPHLKLIEDTDFYYHYYSGSSDFDDQDERELEEAENVEMKEKEERSDMAGADKNSLISNKKKKKRNVKIELKYKNINKLPFFIQESIRTIFEFNGMGNSEKENELNEDMRLIGVSINKIKQEENKDNDDKPKEENNITDNNINKRNNLVNYLYHIDFDTENNNAYIILFKKIKKIFNTSYPNKETDDDIDKSNYGCKDEGVEEKWNDAKYNIWNFFYNKKTNDYLEINNTFYVSPLLNIYSLIKKYKIKKKINETLYAESSQKYIDDINIENTQFTTASTDNNNDHQDMSNYKYQNSFASFEDSKNILLNGQTEHSNFVDTNSSAQIDNKYNLEKAKLIKIVNQNSFANNFDDTNQQYYNNVNKSGNFIWQERNMPGSNLGSYSNIDVKLNNINVNNSLVSCANKLTNKYNQKGVNKYCKNEKEENFNVAKKNYIKSVLEENYNYLVQNKDNIYNEHMSNSLQFDRIEKGSQNVPINMSNNVKNKFNAFETKLNRNNTFYNNSKINNLVHHDKNDKNIYFGTHQMNDVVNSSLYNRGNGSSDDLLLDFMRNEMCYKKSSKTNVVLEQDEIQNDLKNYIEEINEYEHGNNMSMKYLNKNIDIKLNEIKNRDNFTDSYYDEEDANYSDDLYNGDDVINCVHNNGYFSIDDPDDSNMDPSYELFYSIEDSNFMNNPEFSSFFMDKMNDAIHMSNDSNNNLDTDSRCFKKVSLINNDMNGIEENSHNSNSTTTTTNTIDITKNKIFINNNEKNNLITKYDGNIFQGRNCLDNKGHNYYDDPNENTKINKSMFFEYKKNSNLYPKTGYFNNIYTNNANIKNGDIWNHKSISSTNLPLLNNGIYNDKMNSFSFYPNNVVPPQYISRNHSRFNNINNSK